MTIWTGKVELYNKEYFDRYRDSNLTEKNAPRIVLTLLWKFLYTSQASLVLI